MRGNPKHLAWIVLLGSFFVCVALSVMTPLSVRRYVRHSRIKQQASLQVQRGPLSVVRGGRGRPVSVAEESDSVLEGSRIMAPNAASGRLMIETLRSTGATPIATVQLYDGTEFVLSSARSPRFAVSPLPHKVDLEMEAGRVRVNVFGNNERSTIVEVHTAHGQVSLEEGSYEVKINSTTEVTVRYGQAVVVNTTGDALSLGPRERALVGTVTIDGPLPAARNLIVNGNFQNPLGDGWDTYREQTDPDQPPGEVDVITALVGNEERRVAKFYRNASNHAEVGIEQAITYDVRDFTSLELHMAMRIVSQNILGFGGCGYLGSECPIILRIDYKDEHGTDREW
ncbi:MAG: FecR domain-containing protein, partial [Anaerolineae bacterium]